MPNIHAAIKIHPVDADSRIIFDSQINVFADTETEIASFGEVPPLQLVFLDFQSSLEDFFGFGTSNGDVDGDFLVTTDAECSNGVAGFACEKTNRWRQRIESNGLYRLESRK